MQLAQIVKFTKCIYDLICENFIYKSIWKKNKEKQVQCGLNTIMTTRSGGLPNKTARSMKQKE
jgi:hypothetical protein